ncbi:MAG: alpha/beta hydrolase [[Pasteurella] aerogenes]|nr:alpha/beta hydrolase [[Pasteurella] aerogenes]
MCSRKYYFWGILFLFFSWLGAYFVSLIERDFGRIEVNYIEFMTQEMQPMAAKLYRPLSATTTSPKPGILALHGYQSDKEATSTFGALELAKRGFVVLAIDHFGHGFSTKLPAANKNMSGANNGYQYLKSLPFVDKDRLGILGHSTGALNAIRVAKLNPDHKAVNGLSSNGGDMELHNYLLTQGLYEEIGGYRERIFPVSDLMHHSKRLKAFGLAEDQTLQWNYTYGDFNNGSARRAALVNGTHLGVMISPESNKEAILWFNQALQNGQKGADWQDPKQQTYWYKEFASLFALVCAVIGCLCFAAGLLTLPYFRSATQAVSQQTAISGKKWWGFTAVNIVLTLLLYPICTQWGGANEPIAAKVKLMPLEMGNGIILWLVVSTLVGGLLFAVWQRSAVVFWKTLGVCSQSSGLTTAQLIGRYALLSFILVIGLYGFVSLVYQYFHVELRFLWPLLKPLTAERFNLFFVYWIPIFAFFTVFNGLIMSVQMKQRVAHPFTATLLIWTVKSAIFATGGLVILWAVHFIPDFMQIGPGLDVLGLPQFGGRWMMMLAVIIPQFIVFILINHWCYLKTGYIYLGIFFTSLLMTWILVGGQVIGRFLA